MGIEYSTFNILGNTLVEETSVATKPDGTTVTTKKRNPWVAGTVVVCVTGIFLTYMDGGKGTVSKALGSVCKECSKQI
jgi:hypothetical protein